MLVVCRSESSDNWAPLFLCAAAPFPLLFAAFFSWVWVCYLGFRLAVCVLGCVNAWLCCYVMLCCVCVHANMWVCGIGMWMAHWCSVSVVALCTLQCGIWMCHLSNFAALRRSTLRSVPLWFRVASIARTNAWHDNSKICIFMFIHYKT